MVFLHRNWYPLRRYSPCCGVALSPAPLARGAECPCDDDSAVHNSSGDRAGERSATKSLPFCGKAIFQEPPPPPAASAPSSLSSIHVAPPRRYPPAISPSPPLHRPPVGSLPPRRGRWRRGFSRRGAAAPAPAPAAPGEAPKMEDAAPAGQRGVPVSWPTRWRLRCVSRAFRLAAAATSATTAAGAASLAALHAVARPKATSAGVSFLTPRLQHGFLCSMKGCDGDGDGNRNGNDKGDGDGSAPWLARQQSPCALRHGHRCGA